jgi:hypothetical protein
VERKGVGKVQKSPVVGGRVPAQSSARSSVPRHPLIELQRSIGNQAVQRLINSPIIQAKLQVSTPDDPFEQEADRVADTVMRMPEPASGTLVQRHVIQRPGSECEVQREEEDELPVEDDDQDIQVQTQTSPYSTRSVSTSLTSSIRAMDGGGSPLPASTRAFFEPRFGADFSRVRVHTDSRAAQTAESINARAFTVGQNIVFGAGQYATTSNEGQRLLAHELTHTVQQGASNSASPLPIMRGKGKVAQKVVGWVVKVGERKLIKTVAIYSENELTKLLSKGYNILVKRGSSQAKRIAEKVWGSNVIHHTGHIIRKTGKIGLSHFQPAKHLIGRAGEKGWHVFYSAAAILFFADDVEAMEVYEDKYPGKSIANYLTVTQYVGEDSWLSNLDWINPLELIAIGGDIGRNWDRERTKELKALVFNRVAKDGTVQTYELDPEGQLVRVILVKPDGKQKTLTADEYFTFLGKKAEESVQAPPAQDGTKHPVYKSTFDADYRIYIADGWTRDPATLSIYMPESAAKRLERVGEFYVLADFSINSVYVYVHPRHQVALKTAGFQIPEDKVSEYFWGGQNEEFLNEMLTAVKVQGTDLWQAK